MSDLDRAAVLDALGAAYQNVTAVAGGLGEADLMRPSRCAGWAVADVLYHQLLDARRALRTFASPSDGPVDCDDVSYWADYAPAAGGGRRGRRRARARGRVRGPRALCPHRRGRVPPGRAGLGVVGDRGGRLPRRPCVRARRGDHPGPRADGG